MIIFFDDSCYELQEGTWGNGIIGSATGYGWGNGFEGYTDGDGNGFYSGMPEGYTCPINLELNDDSL